MNLGRWKKALCPNIGISNEVSTSESLQLDYARLHSCMYSRALDYQHIILEARIELRGTSLHILTKNATFSFAKGFDK